MKTLKTNLYVLLGVFIASCSVTQKTASENEKMGDFTPLISQNWVLTDNDETFKNYSGEYISFRFNADQSSIEGFGSCNQYTAQNSQVNKDGSMSVGMIMSTKKYCPDMKIETNYFELLQSVNRYKIENGKLQLYKDQWLLLTFVPATE